MSCRATTGSQVPRKTAYGASVSFSTPPSSGKPSPDSLSFHAALTTLILAKEGGQADGVARIARDIAPARVAAGYRTILARAHRRGRPRLHRPFGARRGRGHGEAAAGAGTSVA